VTIVLRGDNAAGLMWSSPRVKRCIAETFPAVFRRIDAEVRRKNNGRLSMEVGVMRERAVRQVAALYGREHYKKPERPGVKEYDFELFDRKQSVKTVTVDSFFDFGRPKLCWTSGEDNAEQFCSQYRPASDLILVRISWNQGHPNGGFYYIPREAQVETRRRLGERYLKTGTGDSKGVFISAKAGWKLLYHYLTIAIPICWGPLAPMKANDAEHENHFAFIANYVSRQKGGK
jgi:hypothetical protein